jgi:hypothetical protein
MAEEPREKRQKLGEVLDDMVKYTKQENLQKAAEAYETAREMALHSSPGAYNVLIGSSGKAKRRYPNLKYNVGIREGIDLVYRAVIDAGEAYLKDFEKKIKEQEKQIKREEKRQAKLRKMKKKFAKVEEKLEKK